MNQYTFDGCGINGPDKFKTQVLAIAKPEQRNDPMVRAFCKKAAASEEMLAALEAVDRADVYMHERGGALLKVRAAIRKARGE